MTLRIVMLAVLLATGCGDDEDCFESACYSAYVGKCGSYALGQPNPIPTCAMQGWEERDTCPIDGLVASCMRPGDCPGRTEGTYFYNSFTSDGHGDLVYQENTCRNAGYKWTTY